MIVLNWIAEHWLDTLQSVGVIAGLLYTGFALRMDTRVQRLQNNFTLTKNHREIWSLLYTHPELSRVLDASTDIKKQPPSLQEGLFVRLIILHLNDAYRASRLGLLTAPEKLAEDVRDFFRLPIPRETWHEMKRYQDERFVDFVEKAVQ